MKSFCLLACLFVGFVVHAQESDWGTFRLPDGGVFGVVIDYSQAKLAGLTYEEYIEFDPSFEDEIRKEDAELIHHLNETFGDSSYPRLNVLHFSPIVEGRGFIIVFNIQSATNKGAMVTNVVFKDKDGITVATIKGLKSRGSRYGTFINLIGDGFEKLADEFYSEVQDAMKHKKI